MPGLAVGGRLEIRRDDQWVRFSAEGVNPHVDFSTFGTAMRARSVLRNIRRQLPDSSFQPGRSSDRSLPVPPPLEIRVKGRGIARVFARKGSIRIRITPIRFLFG